MRKLAIAVIAAAIPLALGVGPASEWVSIAKFKDSERFIDLASIRIAGDVRRGWLKTVLAPHTRKDPHGSVKWLSYTLVREAYNCSEETNRLEASTDYYEDGSFYNLPAQNYPTRWIPVRPETVGNTTMQFICAWTRR